MAPGRAQGPTGPRDRRPSQQSARGEAVTARPAQDPAHPLGAAPGFRSPWDPAAWRPAITRVLRDPDQPQLVFQPIVDLKRGVVAGYEALARFAGPPDASPDAWFAAADRLDLGAELEAKVVRGVLDVRGDLPPDCFVTVNLSPHLLGEPELADALDGDLRRVVLELTEHVPVAEHTRLRALLDRCRAAGATVALDDAGAGYSGLQQIALVRPEMVKLDRALVSHADRDEVKLALVELLGTYAGRLDAVLVAEGVERPEELAAFVRMGVPLAQGWLFARPGPRWPGLPAHLGEQIRALAARSHQLDSIGSLAERTAVVPEHDLGALRGIFAADPRPDLVAVLDRYGRASCLLRADGTSGPSAPEVVPVSLRAVAGERLAEVAARAMTRPPATRFDPVVCGDEYGSYLGIVRPERMVLRLAASGSSASSASSASSGS